MAAGIGKSLTGKSPKTGSDIPAELFTKEEDLNGELLTTSKYLQLLLQLERDCKMGSI